MDTLYIKQILISKLGIKQVNQKIIKIADIMNDLDYFGLLDTLTNTQIAETILNILNNKHYKTVFQIEQARDNLITEWHIHGNHAKQTLRPKKYVWKSTAENLYLLNETLKMRKEKIKWKDIKKRLSVDARNLVYSIKLGTIKHTQAEYDLALKILNKNY